MVVGSRVARTVCVQTQAQLTSHELRRVMLSARRRCGRCDHHIPAFCGKSCGVTPLMAKLVDRISQTVAVHACLHAQHSRGDAALRPLVAACQGPGLAQQIPLQLGR